MLNKLKKTLILLLAVAMLLGVLPLVSACDSLTPHEKVVKYSDFGALGDGVTDDFEAICATHAYANEHGVAVAADKGATYYIGGDENDKKTHEKTAVIKTNTYWQDAKFIIDDRGITKSAIRFQYIFSIESDEAPQKLEIPEGYTLSVGQKNVNMNFEKPVMLLVVNKNHKDFIRHGPDQNAGADRQEVIVVDMRGRIDKSTPLTWDYEQVTSLTAISVTDRAITVSGGQFVTVANDNYTAYYRRNICISRSNTTVRNVVHTLDYSANATKRSPYAGFFDVQKTANIEIRDCEVEGNHINSSYELAAKLSNNVLWKNVIQSNGYEGNGVFGSNQCRNLVLDGCSLNRFDAHMGVYNATLKNSSLNYICVTGFGKLLIQNVVRNEIEADEYCSSFLVLRTDYGAFWRGDIEITNCILDTNCTYNYLIYADWSDWDFGYTCYMPKTLTVKNLKINYSGHSEKQYWMTYFRVDGNRPMESFAASKNPLVPPEKVTIINCNMPFTLSNYKVTKEDRDKGLTGLFDNTVFVQK